MTTTNVTLIKPPSEHPRKEVIEAACTFINALMAGKVDGFAAVALHKDGSVVSYITPSDDVFRIVGAVDRMRHRLHKQMDD